MTDQCVFCSDYIYTGYGTRAFEPNSRQFQTRNTIHDQTHATTQLRMLFLHVFVS